MIALLAAAAVVLGSAHFAPAGNGFGTAHPSHFHNGGDPSGGVNHVRWRGWGRRVAYGRGLNPIFEPEGGYFAQEARVLLRAQRIGTCPDGTGPAYTELFIRGPQWPGGPRGPWTRWGSGRTICSQGRPGDEGGLHLPGDCGYVGRSRWGVGSVFGLTAYRLRCRTVRHAARVLAHAGCGATGCRRTVARLHCRLERLHPADSAPFGHHPAQRTACTRGAANFTGWLVLRKR